jgi:hypothetical protein
MIYILQIQQILGCTIEHATSVFNEMCVSGFDFSEASKRKFKSEVIACNELIKA